MQADTITALGGEPVNIGTGWLDEVAAGNIRGIEFDIPEYYNNGLSTEAGNVTSNVVLWPKVYVSSLSQDTFDGLTEEQRGWVREAAEQASQTSVEATYDETTLARELCETGTRSVPASAEQLDALHAAVARSSTASPPTLTTPTCSPTSKPSPPSTPTPTSRTSPTAANYEPPPRRPIEQHRAR